MPLVPEVRARERLVPPCPRLSSASHSRWRTACCDGERGRRLAGRVRRRWAVCGVGAWSSCSRGPHGPTARRETAQVTQMATDFGLRVGGRRISIVMPLSTEQQHVVLSAAKSEFSSNILCFLVFDKARLEAFDLGFQHGALPRLHEPHQGPHAHLRQRSSDAALNGVWLYAWAPIAGGGRRQRLAECRSERQWSPNLRRLGSPFGGTSRQRHLLRCRTRKPVGA